MERGGQHLKHRTVKKTDVGVSQRTCCAQPRPVSDKVGRWISVTDPQPWASAIASYNFSVV